jgi:hypothetical protein
LVRSIGIACGILVLAGVQNASAQIVDTVEFTTSFPFTVGNSVVPAGSYTIRPDDDNPSILHLSGANASVLFQAEGTETNDTPSKTEVVFKRYGNGYILKDIWIEGSNEGVETTPAEAERHVAKNQGSESEHRVSGKKSDTAK